LEVNIHRRIILQSIAFGQKRFRWPEKSAAQGERDGFRRLGDCFRYGTVTGDQGDIKRAKENFLVAAELGNVVAMGSLAGLLDKDDPQRFLWLGKAASNGKYMDFLPRFGGNKLSAAHATKLLLSAASRGNEEADWLQSLTTSRAAVEPAARLAWLAEIMSREGSSRAKYYQARAEGLRDDLLSQSAESGYAPAMSRLGMNLMDDEREDEGFSWLRKAVEQQDADGCDFMAR
jgi:TPR repeat protein